jgi:hypothetical protein
MLTDVRAVVITVKLINFGTKTVHEPGTLNVLDSWSKTLSFFWSLLCSPYRKSSYNPNKTCWQVPHRQKHGRNKWDGRLTICMSCSDLLITYMLIKVVAVATKSDTAVALHSFVGIWPLFQFLHFYTVSHAGLARRKAATYTQDSTNTE